MRRFLLPATLLVFVSAFSAHAAEKAKAAEPAKASEPSRSAAQKQPDSTPASIKMDQVEIRGEFENPDVFYIIPRRKAEMDTGSLSMDYSKDIMAPVVQHVFEAEHSREGQKPLGN